RMALMRTAGSTSCRVKRTFTREAEAKRGLVFEMLGAQNRNGVVDDWVEREQPVLHAAGRSRKIHNERFLTGAGEPTRRPRARERVDRLDPNPFGDPRRLAFQSGGGGWGGEIARTGAGPASGDHQVGLVGVGPMGERRDDLHGVVGDEGPSGQ